MRVSLQDLVLFNNCPRLCKISPLSIPPVITSFSSDLSGKVIWEVMKRTLKYMGYEESEYPWKHIRAFVSSEVLGAVDSSDRDLLEISQKQAESILELLSKWHTHVSGYKDVRALRDMECVFECGDIFITAEVPLLVCVDGVHRILLLNTTDKGLRPEMLCDNLELMMLSALTGSYFHIENPIVTQVDFLSGRYSFRDISFIFSNEEIKDFLHQMSLAIKSKMSYPSLGAGCVSCSCRSLCRSQAKRNVS